MSSYINRIFNQGGFFESVQLLFHGTVVVTTYAYVLPNLLLAPQ